MKNTSSFNFIQKHNLGNTITTIFMQFFNTKLHEYNTKHKKYKIKIQKIQNKQKKKINKNKQ